MEWQEDDDELYDASEESRKFPGSPLLAGIGDGGNGGPIMFPRGVFNGEVGYLLCVITKGLPVRFLLDVDELIRVLGKGEENDVLSDSLSS